MSILGKIARPSNKAPVPYAPRGGGGMSGLFGGGKGKVGPSEDQLKAVMSSGTLFAIIDALSTSVSAVDWDLYRVSETGRKDEDEEREAVTKHAALDVWNRPNPFMTGTFLRELVQQHIDLTGEGAMLVVKQGTLPLELWPVRPDKLAPVPHPTKFLAGWIYTDADGEKIPFKVDEVLHIRKPSALDPYRGASAVDAIGVDLEAADFAAQWNRNFFLNSAEPGGIVAVDRRLGDDEFDELVMRWNEQHRGVQRAHRVAILEAGTYIPRSFSQRDMQFSELRNASRDVIMEAFRVSKTSLGITDDVNRASALASEYQFSSKLTVPRLNRWRDCLNWQFLPMFGSTGKGVEFDFESPVQADVESDALDRTSKVNAAVAIMAIPGVKFDVNEVFNAYGLPEIDYEEVAVPLPGQNFGPDGEPLPPDQQPDPNAPPGQAPGGAPPAKKDDEKPAAGPKNLRADWDENDHKRDGQGRFSRMTGDELAADYLAKMPELEPDERAALHGYTGGDYAAMNGWLRGSAFMAPADPSSPLSYAAEQVAQLKSLAGRYRTPGVVTARRFVNANAIPAGAQVGETFTDRGFSSTTLDEARPAGFSAEAVEMVIDVPAGMPAIVAKPHGRGVLGENELILPPGTRYLVTYDETFEAEGVRLVGVTAMAPEGV